MKNHDFESRTKEHKDINNNLAIPLYREFCKEYELSFHFADEKSVIKQDIPFEILHNEMPLHDKALSLFNFVNEPYHPFNGSLVSFAFTSSDDFHYDSLSLEEIAREMEKKDAEIRKLNSKYFTSQIIASISTIILAVTIVINLINPQISSLLSPVLIVIALTLVLALPPAVYALGNKFMQRKFKQKLVKLKGELRKITN